jgi:hypothetical protein
LRRVASVGVDTTGRSLTGVARRKRNAAVPTESSPHGPSGRSMCPLSASLPARHHPTGGSPRGSGPVGTLPVARRDSLDRGICSGGRTTDLCTSIEVRVLSAASGRQGSLGLDGQGSRACAGSRIELSAHHLEKSREGAHRRPFVVPVVGCPSTGASLGWARSPIRPVADRGGPHIVSGWPTGRAER